MAIHYLGQMIVELDHEPTGTVTCEVGPELAIHRSVTGCEQPPECIIDIR